MALDKLALQLRTLQLFYHNCHNTTKGPSFNGDHAMFGDFYGAVEGDYDSVVERFIGLFGEEALHLNELAAKAVVPLLQAPPATQNADMCKIALSMEQAVLKCCEECDRHPQYSVGTKALVGDIANATESRAYKLKQRIK